MIGGSCGAQLRRGIQCGDGLRGRCTGQASKTGVALWLRTLGPARLSWAPKLELWLEQIGWVSEGMERMAMASRGKLWRYLEMEKEPLTGKL